MTVCLWLPDVNLTHFKLERFQKSYVMFDAGRFVSAEERGGRDLGGRNRRVTQADAKNSRPFRSGSKVVWGMSDVIAGTDCVTIGVSP